MAHEDTSTDIVDEEVVDDFSDNDSDVAVDTFSGSYIFKRIPVHIIIIYLYLSICPSHF